MKESLLFACFIGIVLYHHYFKLEWFISFTMIKSNKTRGGLYKVGINLGKMNQTETKSKNSNVPLENVPDVTHYVKYVEMVPGRVSRVSRKTDFGRTATKKKQPRWECWPKTWYSHHKNKPYVWIHPRFCSLCVCLFVFFFSLSLKKKISTL